MSTDQIEHIVASENYALYVVERYLSLFGPERTLDILKAFQRAPVTSINVNTCNVDVKDLIARMEAKRFHLEPVPWCNTGFWLHDARDFEKRHDLGSLAEYSIAPGATHEYLLGLYSIQNASSMLPPVLLDPQPGEQVLDMAAAPGSKFVQMGQMMRNKGILVGVERTLDRIPALKANVQRCGVTNSVIACNDSRELGEQFKGFDKVLLDAPCTGEGLMGSDPSRKNSRSVGDIETMMNIQIQLLEKAVSLVRPGGRVVYSTCSLAPEEDEHVVNEILKKHKRIKVVEPPEAIARHFEHGLVKAFQVKFREDLKNAVRVFPYHHPTRPEGFFAAILEKPGSQGGDA
ncbi:MAG: RsmB/NOP family class I SAM-dependent RNA methyltransferase [Candidatus Lokiarchaeota archaeon]|nr:RsmB/NOP family class I SAM-dependent RNA methyltransferase [Candidatus Lokiarchaeota archaeon]